jgi:Fic family protein
MENTLLALELKSQLDQLRPINKEQESRIIQKFRLDWNYHSNHLEGNSLTYGETKALILFGITAQGKPLKDHFEITGHNDAINWVVDVVKGDFPLTEKFIRELHTLLLKESYEVDAISPDGKPTKKRINIGSYKTSANHVLTKTGEIFYFATPEETPSKMHDLLVWYNEKINDVDKNPILIAAEFHYKFIRIHPFDDGNGRTARILMNFILMQFNYPPVIIKTEDKTNYFAVLQMADAGNIEAFLEYIAQNLVRSLEIMIAGANGENIEEDDDLDKEIALLEQRLGKVGDKSKINKNYFVLKDLIKNELDRISKKYDEKSHKLKGMYFINTYNLFLGILNKESLLGTEYIKNEKINTFEDIDFYDFEKIEKLILKIDFQTFNILGMDEFNFSTEISVILSKIGYKILYGIDFIQKTYGTNLSDIEIDKIVKSEVKRHKEFIEQKIAEKENK